MPEQTTEDFFFYNFPLRMKAKKSFAQKKKSCLSFDFFYQVIM